MEHKVYQGIRRVSRLEYLFIVLRNAHRGYDHDKALEEIQKHQADLEAKKANALGRIKARPVSGKAVLRESEKMARQMRYIDRGVDGFTLSDDGYQLLQSLPKNGNAAMGNMACALLTDRFWSVYPKFGRAIVSICSQVDGTMDLPLPNDNSFKDALFTKYGQEIDALSFKIIREIGTELELINWHLIGQGDDRLQRVFSICCISSNADPAANLGENGASDLFPTECMEKMGLQRGFIKESRLGTPDTKTLFESAKDDGNTPTLILIEKIEKKIQLRRYPCFSIDKFEEVMWKKYLELVNYRQLFPALYPELRDNVCYEMRISDSVFDGAIKGLINNPIRVRVYPSGGTLDYSRRFAQLHKYLPPQTIGGKYITFIKIKRV
jgi:hypothetical protein